MAMPGKTTLKENQRTKRGAESAVIVQRLVRLQLRGMNCERFDLGIKHDNDKMTLRETQSTVQIETAIKWLRHQNGRGAHIYVRPAGNHCLSLIDDLTEEALKQMTAEGFEPAVVVETSPSNFQAWVNHGQILDAAMSTRAAKQLAQYFGGDLSSADWRHFGRLAGFTNPKPERRLPSGMRPFARLRSATGRVYSKAAEFLANIRTNADECTRQSETPQKRRPRRRWRVRPLDEFHAATAYGGDLHRADMAWAKHAAGCGLTMEQIKNELLNGRDLSKKGSRRRQLEYAKRTARKAIEQAGVGQL